MVSEADGTTWSSLTPYPSPNGKFAVGTVDVPGLGYESSGDLVAAWRGFRAAGAYDVYAATITAEEFGPTLKLNQRGSPYSRLVQPGNFSFGGGDFSTRGAGTKTHVFAAFLYSPGKVDQTTTLAKIPASQMK